MLARRFFYVSAALFLLALTYHLGATNAVGQTGRRLVAGSAAGSCGIDESGSIWLAERSGICTLGPLPPPRGGAVVDVYGYISNGCEPFIDLLYEDGDWYQHSGGAWAYRGNVFGGAPTGATPTTMGRVKATYR